MIESLNPEIWGPHYWFFLRTIVLTYPKYPNSITKKKYYTFFQNLTLFIPNKEISNNYETLLNIYPLNPYLNNRESLCKWLWFINNKINEKLGKPQISIDNFYINYYNLYATTNNNLNNKIFKIYKKIFYFILILLFIGLSYYFYIIN
jgi:hypothetical protein